MESECTVSFARYGQEPKKGNGMTKKVADLLVDVLA